MTLLLFSFNPAFFEIRDNFAKHNEKDFSRKTRAVNKKANGVDFRVNI